MKKPPYFKQPRSAAPVPQPLSFSIQRTARFEEVDPLSIVWHGRYASYFEDARVAFGDRYGIGYLDFYREHVAAPVKVMHIDYHAPLRFAETCTVTATLHWTEAARINFEYAIHGMAGQLLTTGYTVQLFLQPDGELAMAQPDFYADFCRRWNAGELL